MPFTTSLLSITLTRIPGYLLALSAPRRACGDPKINLRLLFLECLWQEWGGQGFLPPRHEARPSSTLYGLRCLLQVTVQWDGLPSAWFLGKDTKAWRLDGDVAYQRQKSSLNLNLHHPLQGSVLCGMSHGAFSTVWRSPGSEWGQKSQNSLKTYYVLAMCKDLSKGGEDGHSSCPREVEIRTKHKPSQMMEYLEIDYWHEQIQHGINSE